MTNVITHSCYLMTQVSVLIAYLDQYQSNIIFSKLRKSAGFTIASHTGIPVLYKPVLSRQFKFS